MCRRTKNIYRDRHSRGSEGFEDPEMMHVTDQISDVSHKVYSHAKSIAEQLANKVIEDSQIPPEEPEVVRGHIPTPEEAPNVVIYDLKPRPAQEKDFPLPEAAKPVVVQEEKSDLKVDEGNKDLKDMKQKLLKDDKPALVEPEAKPIVEKKSPSLEKKREGLMNKLSDMVFKTEDKIEDGYDFAKKKISDAYDRTKDALGSLKDRTMNLFSKKKDYKDTVVIPPGQKVIDEQHEGEKIRDTENFINKFKLEVPGESVFEPEKPLDEYKDEVEKSKTKFVLEESLGAFKSKDRDTFVEEKVKFKKTFSDLSEAQRKQKDMEEAFQRIMFEDD